MSHHLLHIFKHGCVLSKDRGFLVCRGDDKSENRIPHEDVRAVIIAARGVTLTSSFVSAILETDGVILHCNERYQPCGMTLPLGRVVDNRSILHQSERPPRLNHRIWQALLHGKTLNQLRVLKNKNLSCARLELALKRTIFDEGNLAKSYWKLYFPSIGSPFSRNRKLGDPPNQMLNYGYSVLSTLCHRSLIVHGLSTLLGVKHSTRYRADPLVYDLMEPYRPFVDLILSNFISNENACMPDWCKCMGTSLREIRVQGPQYSLKLMDAIDRSAATLARCYAEKSADLLWVPELPVNKLKN